MKCPTCGAENPENKTYCGDCGSKLVAICPKCQCKNPPSNKFCGDCGYELSTPTFHIPKPSKRESRSTAVISDHERKYITILFSDLSGYTAMSERLDPEEVKEIMGQIFGEIAQVVVKYEGFIDKFIGDAVMVLFGVPKAHEDDTIRALRAALEIHEIVKGIGPSVEKRIGMPLSMHTGINTGLVVTGDVNLEKGTPGILGDAINVASRLQDTAQSGQILVGPDTYRATREIAEYRSLPPISVKGKEEPIPIYELLAVRKKAEYVSTSAGHMISSAMVGRDDQIQALEFYLMKALMGQGSIVSIIGEPGIGKSRLIAELTSKEVTHRVTVLKGRAISIGRTLSFHLIIDLLKDWSGIAEDDGNAESLNKLGAAIRNITPEAVEEITPFVATLMGMRLTGRYAERIMGVEGEALEKIIMKNVRDLLINGSERRTLVIILEDLHWADNSSLELIESLFRLVETQKVVFIAVFRPGYENTGEKLRSFAKENFSAHYHEIHLENLDTRQGDTLITNLLQSMQIPHGVRAEIIQRSGGNPFFIEEVVRSLIGQQAIIRKNGEYQVTDKIHDVVIPQRINDVLMARIDHLESKTRELVRMASVIGRSFFYRIIAEVAKTIDDIDGRLKHLEDIQLIRERIRLDELEYLFKHALAQEAAYESILLQRRKELHLLVADTIEKVFGAKLHEFYGMLAFHYSQAEDPDKTEEYLIKAGEESLKASASSEALHYYQQALDLYLRKYGKKADPAKVTMLEKNIALALYNRGQYAESIPYFDKVLAYYGETTPRSQILKVLKCGAGFFVCLVSLYLPFLKHKKEPSPEDSEFFSLFYKKCAAISITDPKEWVFQAFYFYRRFSKLDFTKIDTGTGYVSIIVVLFAFTGLSFTVSRKLLTFVRDRVDMNHARSALYYKTNFLIHYITSGDTLEEIEFDHGLIEKNIAIGEFFYINNYLWWTTITNTERGNFSTSEILVRKLFYIGETYDNDLLKMCKFIGNGFLLMKQRKLHEALHEIQEGIQTIEKTGFKIWLIVMYALKARIEVILGDVTDATNSLEKADTIKSETTVVPLHLAYFFLSRFDLELYQLEEVINNVNKSSTSAHIAKTINAGKQALKMADKFSLTKTETLKLMGVYFWIIGKQRKAIHWWRNAMEEGQRLKHRPEVSRTYFEIGKRLLDPASKYKEVDGITAEEYLGKARTMFEEMDLLWDLDELDKFNAKRISG